MGGSGSVFLVDLMGIDEADDGRLIAGWELARSFLQSKQGLIAAELYRSLRPRARFRFVSLVEVESVDTWRQLIGDPAFPIPEMPLNSHPGLYEVVEEDEVGDGVLVVNAFDIPADAEESSFLDPWHRVHDFMHARQGHRGTRVYRCVGPADFRFVTFARWADEDAFAEAIQSPGFAEVVADMPYDAHTGVYEVIRR